MFYNLFVLALLAQMDPATFEVIRQVALILAFFLEGGMVVPIVKALKNALGWEGWKSFALAAGISGLFGAVTVIADGTITGESFSWDNLYVLVAVIFGASQAVYRMLKDASAAKA